MCLVMVKGVYKESMDYHTSEESGKFESPWKDSVSTYNVLVSFHSLKKWKEILVKV